MKATPGSGPSVQDPVIYDVIISGAGPVGLFLACELALAQCSVLVLEKAAGPQSPLKQLPFGIRGLSALSVEALYRRGLLDELELHKRLKSPHAHITTQGPSRQVGHFAGIPLLQGNIDTAQWKYRLPGSTDVNLLSEMEELETVLIRRATASGVTIQWGMDVTGFEQEQTGVTVHCEGEAAFACKWLVGCDGSRSVVRKAGGFDFAGTEPEFTGYSVLADIADPGKLKPGRNVTAAGMYLQSQPGFVVIQDFDGGAFHGSGQPLTVAHVQEVLRRISGTDVTINALHTATTWTDRARQATRYRNGRVFLAGDAAHIHAPLGGQGLNLGLGDALNLGWKLAAAIRNEAPEGLLASYEAERHPVGMQVLDWSRAQAAIMNPTPESRALYAVMRDLLDTRDGATYVAGRIWGIYTRYDLGSDHPLVGYSVPNFRFGGDKDMGILLREGKGVLLDFEGNDVLKAVADKYGDSLRYITAQPDDSLQLRALLVRPDGIVAWAADGAPDAAALHRAAARWFAPGGKGDY